MGDENELYANWNQDHQDEHPDHDESEAQIKANVNCTVPVVSCTSDKCTSEIDNACTSCWDSRVT